MIKKIQLVMFLIPIFAFQGCNMLDECDDCYSPPLPIWIKVVNANDTLQNLITEGVYIGDSIKMWYEENSVKKYVDIRIVNFNFSENIIQSNATLYTNSGEPKDFYLYFNSSDTDTVTIRVDEHYDGFCTSFDLKEF